MNLVYIIGTYPGLTTTFIDREIRVLRKLGCRIQIVSIRHPWTILSPAQTELAEGVIYLLPPNWLSLAVSQLRYLFTKPGQYLKTLAYLLTRPHDSLGSRLKTLLHFGEGVYAAHKLSSGSWDHIHAHFMDRATTVALVVSRLLKIPYSFTAHATDIYVNPVMLPEKIGEAKFTVTCTGYNQRYLSQASNTDGKVSCIYHGLDTDRYQRDGIQPEPARIVSVGQLKERKGFKYLVDACKQLADRGLDFHTYIIGEGPLRPEMEAQIHSAGLHNRVHLLGALTNDQVIEEYERSSIFVLPAVLGSDGDRDGIPNVILEALSMELPVVSTDHSAIPEVVIDQETGLLVHPGDSKALADALECLLKDPDLGREMGRTGRKLVVERFNPEQNARLLLAKFSETIPSA